MHTIFIKTLGCKVNTFDSQALEQQFVKKGYALVDQTSADLVVLNTCSVTATAEKEARYLLRRYRRSNPHAIHIVTGCYAQIQSARLALMDEVDHVIPNEQKVELVELVEVFLQTPLDQREKFPKNVKMVLDNRQGHFKSSTLLFDTPQSLDRTRAFLKIQDGCNGFCTYCQIPLARGSSRSVSQSLVLEKAQSILSQGVKEIVLTGIHLGDYGEDLSLNQTTHPIATLIDKLCELPGLMRLRLSSLEPSEVTPDLLSALARNSNKICDHFHLPLQSGSDRILKLMRRTYLSIDYHQSLLSLKAIFPKAQFVADIIPGFPSETEEEFEYTQRFIQDIGLHALHVFPYSPRPNTAALKMEGHLPIEIIRKRAESLRHLSTRLLKSYQDSYLGETLTVLWETPDQDGRNVGKTNNYLKLKTKPMPSLQGQITPAKINGYLDPSCLLGSL